jgi:hypothetical protein
LRELQGDVLNYTLNELTAMSDPDTELFSQACAGEAKAAEEGVEEELVEDDEELLADDEEELLGDNDEEAHGIVMPISDVEESEMEQEEEEEDQGEYPEHAMEEEEMESGMDDVDEDLGRVKIVKGLNQMTSLCHTMVSTHL